MAYRVFRTGLFLLLTAVGTFATPQIPDTLIFEGRQYPVYNDILHAYFLKYPEKNPKRDDYRCSAAWDGYHATFEIVNSKLYLKDITDEPCSEHGASALKKVVPSGESLFIDWHTGVLLSMHGENNENPYSLEFLDSFSSYSLFEIEVGIFRRAKHFNNKQYIDYRQRHFDAYKKTDKYREEIKELTEGGRTTTADADSQMRFWIFWKAKKLLVD